MRTVRVLVVAFLVVLSGCSGLFADDSTPTPTPERTSDPTPPPGVTDDGVDDDDLLSAHVRTLQNRSYTVERERTVRYSNGTLLSASSRMVRADGDERLLSGEWTYREYSSRYVMWSNDTVWALTQWSGNEVTTQRGRGLGPYSATAHYDHLYDVFAAVETTVTGRTTDGGVRYHVLGVRFRENPRLRPPPSGRDVEFTATVDADGVVRRYNLSYVAVADGTRVRVTEHFRVRDVGTTTVERPSAETAGTRRSADCDARRPERV